MPIKTTMMYNFTPIQLAKIKVCCHWVSAKMWNNSYCPSGWGAITAVRSTYTVTQELWPHIHTCKSHTYAHAGLYLTRALKDTM